jgi:hypothetical protein
VKNETAVEYVKNQKDVKYTVKSEMAVEYETAVELVLEVGVTEGDAAAAAL